MATKQFNATATRRVGQKTNDIIIKKQLVQILHRALSGNRGNGWEYSIARAKSPVQDENKLWVFERKITFKKVKGQLGKANQQILQIIKVLMKAGQGTQFKQYPWMVSGKGFDNLYGELTDAGEASPIASKPTIKNIVKGYGEIGTELGNHFDHIFERENQIKIIHSAIIAAKESDFYNRFHCVLEGPPGCHRIGQKIIMHDGSLKAVEDIQIGDKLLSPFGGKRLVLRLIRGNGQMYQIIPIKGSSFVVNEDHILTLSRSRGKFRGTLIDVPVRDYLNWSKNKKSNYKLVRSNAVNFDRNDPEIDVDPYFVGLMLGDGSFGPSPRITSHINDETTHQAALLTAKTFQLNLVNDFSDAKPNVYDLRIVGKQGKTNPLNKAFFMHGLNKSRSGTKFIPTCFKFGSQCVRKQILAGLIDSDGDQHGNVFSITTKSKNLSVDLAFVARSLGFAAYVGSRIVNQTTYYVVNLSGNLDAIPTRISRKQCKARKQIKNILHTGFQLIKLEQENFYGFTLDGDGRYLLEDFTITHNCGKSDILTSMGKMLGKENEAYMKVDATSATEAGMQRILLEAAYVPPILLIEEIEKTDEKSLRWLLGILDHRAEIRKTNFHIGHKARNVKMLCLATVNDIKLFEKAMSGALFSRFAHEIHCPRPNRETMARILEREVAKISGDRDWIEPTLKYCMDEEEIDDPRKIVPICLCGRNDLLDGSYQAALRATRKAKTPTGV